MYQIRKRKPSPNKLGIMGEGVNLKKLRKNALKSKLNSIDYYIAEVEIIDKKCIVKNEFNLEEDIS